MLLDWLRPRQRISKVTFELPIGFSPRSHASRPATSFTLTARQRLVQLSDEALQKLKDVDEQLTKEASAFSTSEKMGFDGPLPPVWKKTVTVAFADYEQLCEQYESVRAIRGKLKAHVAEKRRRPEHAAVLNEPERNRSLRARATT